MQLQRSADFFAASDISTLLDQQKLSGMLAVKDWDGCWNYLTNVIDRIRKSDPLNNQIFAESSTPQGIEKIHEFVSLFGKIFITLALNDEVTISDKSYYAVLHNHARIHALLYIMGLENTDAQVEELLARDKKLSPDQQKKLCLLFGLGTSLDIVKVLGRVAVKYRAPALSIYWAHPFNFFTNQEDNKVKLFAFRDDLQKADLAPEIISALNLPYFTISNIGYEDKHVVKRSINTLVRKFLKENRTVVLRSLDKSKIPTAAQIAARKKPVMLVSAEQFSTSHAMYRSWGRLLATLKDYFEVHLMLTGGVVEEEVKKDYESSYVVDFENLGQMFLNIEYLKPDVIFMPSAGMDMNNIMLANMRCAPLQIMALGHPATTLSNHIDFVIGQKDLYDERAFDGGKYIADPSSFEFHPRAYIEKLDLSPPKDAAPKDTVHVGIVGAVPKISAGFFKVLEEIYAEAPFDITFTFLTNSRGIEALALKLFILKKFPKARIYGYQPYERYFERLMEVDIVLNQFPFGHTNTLVDMLLAGKPSISLDGPEPHSKAMGVVLRDVNLEKEFLTSTEEEYKKRFFELAEDIRNGKRNFFNPKAVYEKLFAKNEGQSFGAFMNLVYKNQDELKASGDLLLELPQLEKE